MGVSDKIASHKFADEDESDDGLKDNWDDPDEEPVVATEAPKPTAVSSKKKNLLSKIAEKERKERESKPQTSEELLAEKLERQRLQEESDLLLAKEAFGESNSSTSASGLDINLNTREDFDSFRKSLIDKLLVYDKSPHFVNFLENLFRELCVSIESDDIKRLSSSLTALFNEKVKLQKAGAKGKKKGKGPSVHLERNATAYGDDAGLDDFDDFI
ncbi:unnamed protein product [Medioppia subpectinata]|uniref:EIF3j n=1 Tax=Medioppia subpectinata TaxID=1979941 RepID=A0A7R9PU02_9ACAR|nr:unnamed protein product [Medioppia subpectinata]CAG2100253.1 unnamed protein product [Medioppia subpectinata]